MIVLAKSINFALGLRGRTQSSFNKVMSEYMCRLSCDCMRRGEVFPISRVLHLLYSAGPLESLLLLKMFEKTLSDLVRGIRSHRGTEVKDSTRFLLINYTK